MKLKVNQSESNISDRYDNTQETKWVESQLYERRRTSLHPDSSSRSAMRTNPS